MHKKHTIFDIRPIPKAIECMTIPAPDVPDVPDVPDNTPRSKIVDLMWASLDDAPPALPVFSEPPRNEQARLIKIIGARLREARDLCNMSQQRAAEALGYANSSKLAKIEGATDTNSVPLPLIMRAAKLYDVSMGFLFGLTTDWERDGGGLEDREPSRFLLNAWETARRRDLQALAALYARVRAVASAIDALAAGAVEVSESLRYVHERSVDAFDVLPGGNKLLHTVERHAETARQASGQLLRFRAELLGKAVPVD